MQKILHILLGTVAIVALVGCGGGGGGGGESTAGTSPSSVKYIALSAPNNLSAETPSATNVTLVWSDTSGGKAKFRIYRSGTVIGEIAGSDYTDYAASPNTTYIYQVLAIDASNSSNTSSLSNAATVTTPTEAATISGRCSASRLV